jgi:hypothetical protein
MSAEAVEPSRPSNFRDASPREIRAALIPEEQPDFDRQWRSTMAETTETLELGQMHSFLESWRRRATITTSLGHSGYRRMLTQAENTLRTGEPSPGSVPWSQLKVELGL